MRYTFIITMICSVGLSACGGKSVKQKEEDRCAKARASAVEAWKGAATGWGKAHDRWADAKLVDQVRGKLREDAKEHRNGMDEKKLPAVMQWFDEFVQFKLRLCKRSKLSAERAGKAVRDKRIIAQDAAELASNKTFDLSGVRPEQAAWNTVKQVDTLEKETERAKAGTAGALNRTKAMEKACAQ